MDAISYVQALSMGYQPLAGPYDRNEKWMLDGALADLRRGRRDFVLVIENPRFPTETTIYIRHHFGPAVGATTHPSSFILHPSAHGS